MQAARWMPCILAANLHATRPRIGRRKSRTAIRAMSDWMNYDLSSGNRSHRSAFEGSVYLIQVIAMLFAVDLYCTQSSTLLPTDLGSVFRRRAS